MTTTRGTALRELTVRSVVLGGLITLIFTAANVYLGLKVGLTFATSIPAAVISMAILRYFRDHSILENNIVQTIASAAGTLAAIIFVLPGPDHDRLVAGLPVLDDGGGVRHRRHPRRDVLGAAAPRAGRPVPTCPTRKASPRAEVLKVGERSEEGAEENRKSLRAIVVGGLAAAGFSLLAALEADRRRDLGGVPARRGRLDASGPACRSR